MAFPWTKATQTVPLNGSSVLQRTLADAGGVVTPTTYNQSQSGGSAYAQITTATTTADIQVSSTRPVRVCRILIGGGAMGAITAYDALTATGTALFTKASPVAGDIYDLQCPLQTGLTIVTAAATFVTVTMEF